MIRPYLGDFLSFIASPPTLWLSLLKLVISLIVGFILVCYSGTLVEDAYNKAIAYRNVWDILTLIFDTALYLAWTFLYTMCHIIFLCVLRSSSDSCIQDGAIFCPSGRGA